MNHSLFDPARCPRHSLAVCALTVGIQLLALGAAAVAAATNPPQTGDDADGGEPPRILGDHPAIVVQRLYQTAGFDYASKFYPHPAGMYLYLRAPEDATQVAAPASPKAPEAVAAEPDGGEEGVRDDR